MKLHGRQIHEPGKRLVINYLTYNSGFSGAKSIQRLTQACETVADEVRMIHNLVKLADARLHVAVNKT
jgi:hypothetical protein